MQLSGLRVNATPIFRTCRDGRGSWSRRSGRPPARGSALSDVALPHIAHHPGVTACPDAAELLRHQPAPAGQVACIELPSRSQPTGPVDGLRRMVPGPAGKQDPNGLNPLTIPPFLQPVLVSERSGMVIDIGANQVRQLAGPLTLDKLSTIADIPAAPPPRNAPPVKAGQVVIQDSWQPSGRAAVETLHGRCPRGRGDWQILRTDYAIRIHSILKGSTISRRRLLSIMRTQPITQYCSIRL